VPLAASRQIPAKVTGVTEGPATAVVELDCNGMRLVASITVEAAHELGIAEGRDVTAIVKASDVILGVAD
jgi:molybdopterin-binding protein